MSSQPKLVTVLAPPLAGVLLGRVGRAVSSIEHGIAAAAGQCLAIARRITIERAIFGLFCPAVAARSGGTIFHILDRLTKILDGFAENHFAIEPQLSGNHLYPVSG